MPRFSPGDLVRTLLGKGVVREVRANGRLLVTIGDRNVLVAERDASPFEVPAVSSRKKRRAVDALSTKTDPGPHLPDSASAHARRASQVDLHGLVVADALSRADSALNDAMLAGEAEVHFIHGRSGGRIRGALHRHLRDIPSVRAFRIDPRNEGVTIVQL